MEKLDIASDHKKNQEIPSNVEAEQHLLGSVLVNNDIIDEIANIIKNKDELSLKGSILICNPVPKKYSIPNNIIEKAINSSMHKARQNKIHGKKLTPFLLEKVSSITKGKTLETNIQLMLNNAKLAARIAFALNK